MKHIIRFFLVFLSLNFLFSCSNQDTNPSVDPLSGLKKLKEGYALGSKTKVEIWGKKNFFSGFNELSVVVYDSLNQTEKITDAQVSFAPLMTMMEMGGMSMKHACPFENPEKAENGIFKGSAVFIMPSSPTGIWVLGVKVRTSKYGKEGIALLDISVEDPATPVMTMFTSSETSTPKLVLALLASENFKVGMNDIEFTIHRRQTMMDFPADDSYSIEIVPEMPSMGHGSPNNVNPTSIGKGHYKGKVNFTMTGEWKINIVVKKNGETISKNLSTTVKL